MSDGFQVTMTGLQQAAGVFRAEAGTVAAIMPSGGPASVDGGSAEASPPEALPARPRSPVTGAGHTGIGASSQDSRAVRHSGQDWSLSVR
jgi:hypothetical protein